MIKLLLLLFKGATLSKFLLSGGAMLLSVLAYAGCSDGGMPSDLLHSFLCMRCDTTCGATARHECGIADVYSVYGRMDRNERHATQCRDGSVRWYRWSLRRNAGCITMLLRCSQLPDPIVACTRLLGVLSKSVQSYSVATI